MKWTLIVFIAAVVVAVSSIRGLAQENEWWILEPGTELSYIDAQDANRELSISVTQGDPGTSNLHFAWYEDGAEYQDSDLLLSVDETGDYWWHATDGAYFKRADDHVTQNPILIVDDPLWVGKAWSDTIYQPGWDLDLIYNLECIAEVDLPVPNGTYHSFEIRYTVYWGPEWQSQWVEHKWHCDGVGLVKFILQGFTFAPEINGDKELASIHIPGESDVGVTPPQRISIHNHPNPFNPQTTITFSLERNERASVCVYEMTGRRVAVLADRVFTGGEHSLDWYGEDAGGRALPSGTYVVRLETEDGVEARKVSLVR